MNPALKTQIDEAFETLQEAMNPKVTKELEALEGKLQHALDAVKSFRKNPLKVRMKDGGVPDFEGMIAPCLSSAKFLGKQSMAMDH